MMINYDESSVDHFLLPNLNVRILLLREAILKVRDVSSGRTVIKFLPHITFLVRQLNNYITFAIIKRVCLCHLFALNHTDNHNNHDDDSDSKTNSQTNNQTSLRRGIVMGNSLGTH